MSSTTTFQKDRCNSRGCNTDNNPSLGPKFGTEGIIDIGLSCTPRTIEEEELFEVIINRVHDPLIGLSLITVKMIKTFSSQFCLKNWVIHQLLSNETVDNNIIPVHLRLWHVRIAVQRGARPLQSLL